jgi:hypothetical protein
LTGAVVFSVVGAQMRSDEIGPVGLVGPVAPHPRRPEIMKQNLVRLAVAAVLAVAGIVLVLSAFEGDNPVTRIFCDGGGSFGDRGGTEGVVLFAAAVILAFTGQRKA